MTKRLILAALLCAASLAPAQTVNPVLQPHVNYVDSAGFPCAGCKLFSYSAGTNSPLATYKDSALTANTNPVVLDASGGAYVWTLAGPYKFILVDALGATVWTVDNVPGLPTDATARASASAAQSTATSAATTAASAATVAAAAQVTANAALPAYGMNSSQGTGVKVQHSTGSATSGNFVKFNAAGDTVDALLAVTAVPQKVATCGTTTTCANTTQTSPRIVWGTVVLTSGTPSTAVVASMTAWTATTSYACTVTNLDTAANALSVANTSTSSITITGPNTVTDHVAYICVGN